MNDCGAGNSWVVHQGPRGQTLGMCVSKFSCTRSLEGWSPCSKSDHDSILSLGQGVLHILLPCTLCSEGHRADHFWGETLGLMLTSRRGSVYPKFCLGLRAAKTIADSWFVTYLFQFDVFINHAVFITVWKLSAVGAGNYSINKVFQTICGLLISNHAILFKKAFSTF